MTNQYILFGTLLISFFILFLALILQQMGKDLKTEIEPMKTKTIDPDIQLDFNQWANFIYNQNRKS